MVRRTSSSSNSFWYCFTGRSSARPGCGQRVLVERIERHGDRQAAHQLRDEAVAQQVVRLDVDEGVLLELVRDAPSTSPW